MNSNAQQKQTSDLCRQVDEYFEQYQGKIASAETEWKKITEAIDEGLQENYHEVFHKVSEYMTQGSGKAAAENIGEALRGLRVCNIVDMELEYGMQPLCRECRSLGDLLDKYMLVLFSLRRLCFDLSMESMEEAGAFLTNNQISVICVAVLLREELIAYDDWGLKRICDNMKDVWTKKDVAMLQALLERK